MSDSSTIFKELGFEFHHCTHWQPGIEQAAQELHEYILFSKLGSQPSLRKKLLAHKLLKTKYMACVIKKPNKITLSLYSLIETLVGIRI
jgi:hypothetical protein